MEHNNSVERLYRQFVADMDQPLSERYYDEADLLDVFDYASDVGDDAVRTEVVLLAERLCPGSVSIAERKALLYWSMGSNEAASKVISTIPGKHFLTRLTQLRIKKNVAQLAANDFSMLVKGVKPGTMEDEEVIQLIDAAHEAGQEQWLMDHYELLKQLAQYPETVMYDIVGAVLDSGLDSDFEFVNKALDDLTMASPYDLGFWEYAADVAMSRQEDPERALGCVEYALAINPKSQKSLVLKSDCLLAMDPPRIDEALDAARKAYILYPDEASVSLAYAHALQRSDREGEAMEVLKRHLTMKGCDLLVIVPISMFDSGLDVGDLLRSAVTNVNPELLEMQFDGLVTKYTSLGDYEHLAQIMEVAEELGYVRNYNPEFMVELYFRTDRWEKTLPYLAECVPFNHKIWLLALLMSLPGPNGVEETVKEIDERLKDIDDSITTSSLADIMQYRAIKEHVKAIRETLLSGEQLDVNHFNPFQPQI